MAIWRPDPMLYTSPQMAMEAPAEKLAYVAMVNEKDNGRPDAHCVVAAASVGFRSGVRVSERSDATGLGAGGIR